MSRRRGWQFIFIVVVATLALVGAAAAGWYYARVSAPPTGPVILISIDTLRADHLPAYGYKKVRTPAIDALAAEGTVFERAYAHSPQTFPSHVAILSGRLPFQNGVRDNVGFTIRPDLRMLPKMLQNRGWRTGGVVSAYVLRRELGLDRGFDFYDSQMPPSAPELPADQVRRPGSESLAVAEKWMTSLSSPRFFLFLHLYEPHKPYGPPTRLTKLSPYDAEIASSDDLVGRLIAYLKKRGWYDQATIILLSDHGEGLGDHGEQEHGLFLYDETIKVPLIVKLPGAERSGRRIATPVQQVDLVPTILDWLGAPRPSGLPGRSLRHLLAGSNARLPDPGFYAEALYGRRHFGWSELYALTDARYRFIKAPRPELYDLELDPRERQNVADDRPQPAAAMGAAVDKLLAGAAVQAPRQLPPDDLERLRALGYVAAQPADSTDPAARALRDPKDGAAVLETIGRAEEQIAGYRYGEAASALGSVVAAEPGSTHAWVALGRALERSGRRDEAVAAYRRVVNLDPAHPDGLVNVARVLLAGGKTDVAAANAEMALKMVPAAERRARLRAFVTLVKAAIAAKDLDAGRRWAGAAEQEAPGFLLGKYVDGVALFQQGKYEEALPLFEEAIGGLKAQPLAVPDFYLYGGQALHRLGREAEARAALEEALRLAPADLGVRVALVTVLQAEGHTTEVAAGVDDLVRAVPTADGYAAAIRLATAAGDRARASALKAAARAAAAERRQPAPARPAR